MSLCVSSTERNDESLLLSVDQKSEGKSVVVADCGGNLVDKGISGKTTASVTTLPSEKVFGRAVGGGWGSEHFEGKGKVERPLERGSDANSDKNEKKTEFEVHRLIWTGKKRFYKIKKFKKI